MTAVEKKRSILLITPDYMDYTNSICKGIQQYLNAHVTLVTTTGEDFHFSYTGFLQRLQNFFLKTFTGKNMKRIFFKKKIEAKLQDVFETTPLFDDILVLRPDLIKEQLPLIKTHGLRMLAYFWDSFQRIPAGKETIKNFDKFFSFEPTDVNNHQLLFLPNFYYEESHSEQSFIPAFDISYVASYDKRFSELEQLLSSLQSLPLKMNIYILANRKKIANKSKTQQIQWLQKPLPRDTVHQIVNNSRVLLDIAQPGQKGLSFRFFEAMQLQKKIITTNKAVTGYDFYTPANIFVWENKDTIPSLDFFTSPFTPLENAVIEKYSMQHWVKNIFE
jgi:hypothetical protein